MKKRLLSAILFLSFCLVGLWAKEDIRIINPVLPGDHRGEDAPSYGVVL